MSSVSNGGPGKGEYRFFVRWAGRFLCTPWETRAAITGEELHEEDVIYTQWNGRYRDIVARTAYLQSGNRKLEEPISPGSFDPWKTTDEELSARTTQVVVCPGCDGEKTVVCPTCAGSGHVTCSSCGGSGRAYSSRSNKRVQCQSCRGTGRQRCSCRSGHITCPTCNGVGRVRRWLELEETPFQHRKKLIRLNHDLCTETPAGVKERDVLPPAPRVAWKGKAVTEAPADLQSWFVHQSLVFSPDARHERLDEVGVEIFDRDLVETRYHLAWQNGCVARVGPKRTVIPQKGSSLPFIIRLVVLSVVAILVYSLGMAARSGYQGRHEFYADSANASLLVLASLVLSAAATVLVAVMLNAGLRARRRLVYVPASVMGLTIILGAVAALTGNPSIGQAQELNAAGRADEAEAHAALAIELGYDVEPCKELIDNIKVDRVMKAATLREALAAAYVDFSSPETRKTVETRLLVLALAEIREAQATGNYATTEYTVNELPERMRTRPDVAALLQTAHINKLQRCINSMDTDCTKELFEKLVRAGTSLETIGAYRQLIDRDYQQRFKTKWAVCELLGTPEEKLPCAVEAEGFLVYAETFGARAEKDGTASTGVAAKIESLESEVAANEAKAREEQARVEAAEQAKAERERLREERAEKRRQAAAERAYSASRARCCDGSVSPSCGCGGGRGCCSRHGGVCGCT